jgi:hypothetical protein
MIHLRVGMATSRAKSHGSRIPGLRQPEHSGLSRYARVIIKRAGLIRCQLQSRISCSYSLARLTPRQSSLHSISTPRQIPHPGQMEVASLEVPGDFTFGRSGRPQGILVCGRRHREARCLRIGAPWTASSSIGWCVAIPLRASPLTWCGADVLWLGVVLPRFPYADLRVSGLFRADAALT